MEVKHAWFIQNFGYVLEKAGLLPHLKKQQNEQFILNYL